MHKHVNNHLQIELTKYHLLQDLFNYTCTIHVYFLNIFRYLINM